MKIGSVISNKRRLWVITQMVNETVVETESLEEYIIQNIKIEHNGEMKTIKEIIKHHCDEYLSNNEIIED